jgi:carboxymethylenebutenolidase
MHFGTADGFVPVEAARALAAELEAAGVNVTSEFYEGAGHAFFNDTNRLGTFDADQAQLSWRRTVDFLRTALS